MSKILVSLDPFSKTDAKAKRALQTIRNLANQLNFKLQATAVVSPDQLKLPLDFESNLAEEYLNAGEVNLRKIQSALKVRFDESPEVAIQPYRSVKMSVGAIEKSAELAEADFIAVLTHLKKSRLPKVFGFVESLIATSKKPVLAVNAEAPQIKRIERIVFASDFSDECKQAFIQTIGLAKKLKAEIIVVHKSVELENYVALAAGMMSPMIQAYEPVIEAEESRIESSISEWKKLAMLQNVEVDFVISRRIGSVGDAILNVAKSKRAQLIVVVAQTGKYESLLIGSVTRRILQAAKVPTLVIRDYSNYKGKKNAKDQAIITTIYDDQTNNRSAERNGRSRLPNH